MKAKSILLLAVTIAGTAVISTACQAPPSQSQDNSASSAQAQNTEAPDTSTAPDSGSNGYRQGASLPASLKLTDEQQTKIKAIQEKYRSQMANIFTTEQKNQLKAAREQGNTRAAMKSLNLTDSQKQQIKDLRQSQRQEIDSVLTNEQKQQLQEMRQKRHRQPKNEDMQAPQS